MVDAPPEEVECEYLSQEEKRYLLAAFQELFVRIPGTSPSALNMSVSATKEGTAASKPAAVSADKISGSFQPVQQKFIDLLSRGYHAFLGQLMFDYMDAVHISSYSAFESLVIDCTRTSSSRSMELLWELSHCHSASQPFFNELSRLQRFSYLVLMFSLGGQTISDDEALVASQHIADFYSTVHLKTYGVQATDIEFDALFHITTSYVPHIVKAFQTFFCVLLLRSFESPSYVPYRCVEVMGDSEIVSPVDLAFFGLHSDELQGAWKRLFSSAIDGLSFNRLEHHILGYDGPTCILIKCNNEEKTVLGAFNSSRWKETNRFYGNSKAFLFTIAPKLRIYRSKAPSDSNYQWLNSKAYALPHGLGMGGTLEGFRLFIPESLEACEANHTCTTFEPGFLVPGERFEIDAIEVWACGGVEAVEKGLHAQRVNRDIARETIDKARKVDKAAFFNNAFDQEFLLTKTMNHKQFANEADESMVRRNSEAAARRNSESGRRDSDPPKRDGESGRRESDPPKRDSVGAPIVESS
eukprot:scaffold3161_cov247-Ochromonas_danica.AAC.11